MNDATAVHIMCPNLRCQRVLAVPPTARGKLIRCQQCGLTVRVPTARAGDSKIEAADR